MQLEVHFKSMERVIKNRFKVRQVREMRKNDMWAEDFQVADVFAMDEDLVAMRRIYSSEFFQRFAMAYRNYEAGEWMVARDMLGTCRYTPWAEEPLPEERDGPTDGPTLRLLRFMRHY